MKNLFRHTLLSILACTSLVGVAQDPEIQLLDAVEAKNITQVKQLLESSMNLDYEINGSPLLIAIKHQNIELVELILKAGANPDYYGHYYYSPLHMALILKNNEIVKALINHNVDLEIRESGAIGKTAILFAAEYGDIELLKILLAGGANIDIADNYGDKALAFAAFHGQLEMAKFLVSLSVDVNHQNRNSKTALIHAKDRGHAEIVGYLSGLNAK
ncbi:ankyrin repeat domain-containing protein [Marinicellulosiphila megalodicopiae]|uniref:ankyrin repeat domain-containing protein n=1 Tax=Marinicellulosiphila megalodicopiae TaxID=2724896 RepID=UPI003BB189A9